MQYEGQKEGMADEEDDLRNRMRFTIRNILKSCKGTCTYSLINWLVLKIN